jgi:hypothetical protein
VVWNLASRSWALRLAGCEGDGHLLGADRGPSRGDRVAAGPGRDGVGPVEPVVRPEEGVTVGVEAGDGCVHRVEGVVVAPFPVLGDVIDGGAVDLDLAEGQVALVVGLVVEGIPQVVLGQ